MGEKIIAISDIHGYYDEFVALLKKINYRKGIDKLYILGDFVDRGPKSFEVIKLLRNLQMQYPQTVKVIQGNHDSEYLKIIEMLRSGETYDKKSWELYNEFADDDLKCISMFSLLEDKYKDELINWLANLPYYIEDNNFIFVHAGIDPIIQNIQGQSPQKMLWGKTNEADSMFYFNPAIKDKVVIFGHVSTNIMHKAFNTQYENEIWYDTNHYDKIGIDCGIWCGGYLGALIITIDDNGKENYAEEYEP